ncbi:armadillo-type protein [Mycena leptocephala]|nr:armadillo-type protein [Mycena leptocephala]
MRECYDAFVAQVAGPEERARIVDAICAHGFSNWAVQGCLEAATDPEKRRKIVACMRSRIVDLATNCYGYYVLQKALDCEEEEAALACHETGSLVVQRGFENLEESAKDGIVDEPLGQVGAVFSEVAKSQWGSYCIQHILEHFAMNEQGSKSVVKAHKEGGKEMLERIVQHMCEPAKGFVLLPTFLSFSRLALPVPLVGDQRAALYDCIRVHIVTLRGCKTDSKAIWLFDRIRAYCGFQTYIRSFRFACMTDSNFDTLSFLVHSYPTSR